MRSAVRYARSVSTHVAYQMLGEGPADLVFVWGGVSHLELGWTHPPTAAFFERLAGVCRVIVLDKRGTGLSDRVPFSSSLDTRMDDVRAVLDDVGSETAYVLGESEAAGLSVAFAASHPDRVAGLILYAPLLKVIADEGFPWAHSIEAFERYIDTCVQHWGQGLMMSLHSPSTAHDPVERDYWARLERSAMSPGGFEEHMRAIADLDVRPVLPLVRCPTLVLHRADDPTVPVGQGEHAAATIPGAKLVRLPGADHYPMIGDADAVLTEIRRFVAVDRADDGGGERVLATMLFTDIVGSTETLAAIGDRRWRRLIETHDEVAAAEVDRHRGRLVRTTGDGVLATFDGPARAIQCAMAIRDAARAVGLEIRAGVHAGEVELTSGDIAGIAVHLAARVQGEATAGEVLVSRTVVDLVAGSGLEFADRGTRELRGLPGQWQLFAVAG